jgi:hypothetical protein
VHEQTIDPNWPHYLYGDITDPQSGIMVETTSIPSNPQPFNGFVFTTGSHKSLKGVRQYPVPPEALAGRYHLYGDSSAFKIMGAQEIVEFLVEDGAIPYNIIEEVCSNYAHIPARPSKGKVFPGSVSEEDDIEAYHPPVVNPFVQRPAAVQQLAPKPFVAAPAPQQETPPWEMPEGLSTPPPAMVAPEERFWVSVNGNTEDEPITRSEVQSLISMHPGSTFMLCGTGTGSAWQTPAEAGFTVQVNKPKPPALPKPVAPPPALPSITSTPPPVVAVNTSTPSVSVLTDEEQAEYTDLKAQFDAGTLPTSDLMKFVKYVNRIEKKA